MEKCDCCGHESDNLIFVGYQQCAPDDAVAIYHCEVCTEEDRPL